MFIGLTWCVVCALAQAEAKARLVTFEVEGQAEVVVMVDGKEVARFTLQPGIKQISLPRDKTILLIGTLKSDQKEATFVVQLSDKVQQQHPYVPLQIAERGSVDIDSFPKGAKVLWNGDDTKQQTKTMLKDKEGTHTLTLKKDGYRDWKKDVKVERNKSLVVFAELEKDTKK